MSAIRELCESKYGFHASCLLRQLGGDPSAIFAAQQERFDHPSADISLLSQWLGAPLTPESYADNAYHLIVSECERLFFTQLPRASALSICNALLLSDGASRFAVSSQIQDLSYDADAFCSAWNRHNPASSPICPPATDIG